MSEQRKCSLRTSLLLAACLVLLSGRAAHAQQQSQQQQAGQAAPIPAYVPPGAIGTTDNGDAGQDAPQANALLSGVQNLSVGLETKRSYWQPHFDVTGTADSNSLQTPHGLDWRTYAAISGGVDLHNVTSNSDLMLGYTAGGTFSNDNTVNDGVVQGLNFSEKLSFRRSAISLLDQFSYLPESQFGFGGLGATGLPATGQNVPGLQFNPGQVLLTGRVQTVSNSDAVELDEFVSSRTSLTFSGGYSVLHYFGGSFLDYGVVNSRVGYNYQMTSRDTFAVFYTFGDYRFDLPTNSFDDHSFDLSYGHIINGKLAFQVAAGPVAILPETTTASSPGGSTAAPGNTTQILWSLSTNLEYKERRYGFGAAYNHGVSAGSGALVGNKGDTVTGSATRQMSRIFTSGLTGGFVRAQGLLGTTAETRQIFDYWFGGVTFTEPLTTSLAITASYELQHQTSNAAACLGPACGASVTRHMISIGLGWHERPLLF